MSSKVEPRAGREKLKLYCDAKQMCSAELYAGDALQFRKERHGRLAGGELTIKTAEACASENIEHITDPSSEKQSHSDLFTPISPHTPSLEKR